MSATSDWGAESADQGRSESQGLFLLKGTPQHQKKKVGKPKEESHHQRLRTKGRNSLLTKSISVPYALPSLSPRKSATSIVEELIIWS
eukprot:3787925-Amphidinium_carterae.1